jgi:hypothetical protein
MPNENVEPWHCGLQLNYNRALKKAVARWYTGECGGLLTDTVLPPSTEERRMSLVMA